MTLPSSGQITLFNLVSEFGRYLSPVKLTDYYRNAGLVPTNASTAAIPTSGPIALTHFYGASNTPPVTLSGGSVFAVGTGGNAVARYTLTSGGLEQIKEGLSPYDTVGTWLNSGAASDYDVRVSTTSGGFNGMVKGGESVATWLNLGTTREWTLSAPLNSSSEWDITVEVRLNSSGTVLATAYVNLSSDKI